ncbi:MAG: transposase [Polyangiaceae bacterium]
MTATEPSAACSSKHAREFRGFGIKKIIAMYARGMTVRDIQAHLTDLYGIDVSRDLISRVTDEVVEELRAWCYRSRQLRGLWSS